MLNDNQCFISGRLGRDPDVKYTQNGKPYCRLSVACSYKVKDQERTDWVSVQVWGPLAESCGSNLQKGTRVMVRGRYSSSSYESPQGKSTLRRWWQTWWPSALTGAPTLTAARATARAASPRTMDSGAAASGEAARISRVSPRIGAISHASASRCLRQWNSPVFRTMRTRRREILPA